MIDKIFQLGVKTVCLLWGLWVLLDYLAYHPSLTRVLGDHPFATSLYVFGVLGMGLAYYSHGKIKAKKGQSWKIPYRGILVFAFAQVSVALILLLFMSKTPLAELSSGSRPLYFVIYGTAYFLMLFLVLVSAQSIGQLLLRPIQSSLGSSLGIIQIALGISVLGTVGTLLGFIKLLTTYLIWPILLLPLVLNWRMSLEFLKKTVWEKHHFEIGRIWTLPLVVLTFLVVGYYWIAAFKTIPIGYDGSSLYLNLARIVADSEGLPAGGQAFAWSVFMGMGEVLFGNRTISILLSHTMSIMCLFAIYRFGRRFLSADVALLATMISLTTPYFAFHGIIDEKTDLAFTYLMISALLLLFGFVDSFLAKETLNDSPKDDQTVDWVSSKYLKIDKFAYAALLTGWLLGYVFSIKYTAIFGLFAITGWWFYLRAGRLAFGAALSIVLGLILAGGIYRFGYLSITVFEAQLTGSIFVLIGVALLTYVFRKKGRYFLRVARLFPIMGVTFLLAFSPWAMKHISENESLSIDGLLKGKSNSPDIKLLYDFELGLLPDWGQDGKKDFWSDDPRIKRKLLRPEKAQYGQNTQRSGGDQVDAANASEAGFSEEISRYAGYEATFWRFNSLPYDLTINSNVRNGRYLDIGFLFLFLLPLLILIPGKYDRKRIILTFLLFAAAVIYVAMVYLSIFAPANGLIDHASLEAAVRDNLAVHSGGSTSWWASIYLFLASLIIYLATLLIPLYQTLAQIGTVGTIVCMTLLTLGGFLLARKRFENLPLNFKAFGAFLLGYGFFWWLMGNGIIWYAMPLFVLFPSFLLYWLENPAQFLGEDQRVFSRYFLGGGVGLLVLLSVCIHFTSHFPTDDGSPALFRWPFIDYMSNPNARETNVLKAYNPILPDIQRMVNADLEAKVYRINTHYGYLIERNDTRVFSDPVLEKYEEVVDYLDDETNFFAVLKKQGYEYIFLDLRTASLDQTPEKKLQKKFISLAQQLLQSSDVVLLVTDNLVADPQAPQVRLNNGQLVNARYGLAGQTVQLGNLALFQLK